MILGASGGDAAIVAILIAGIAAVAQVVGQYITARQHQASESDQLKADLDGKLWERIREQLAEQDQRIAELEHRLEAQAAIHLTEVERLTRERNSALRRLEDARTEIDDLRQRVNVLEERQGECRHQDVGHKPDRRKP